MRLSLLVTVMAALLVPSIALASPDSTRPEHPIAIAVNPPVTWGSARSGSLYAALTNHQVVRVNLASYALRDEPPLVGLAISLSGGEHPSNDGRYLDFGAGWMYFVDGLWKGPTFELGVMRRAENTERFSRNMDPESVTRDSVTYAARAMVGWSWDFRRRAFISIAIGDSCGYARGSGITQRDSDLPDHEPMPYRIDHWEWAFEMYTRIGFTFGGGT